MKTDLDPFYSESPLDDWRAIVGADLNYHFANFPADWQPPTAASDFPIEDMQEPLRRVVREWYRFIPTGSRVLDLGAGWGGPASLLRDEQRCHVHAVTISSAQQAWLEQHGFASTLHDLDAGLPTIANEGWDVAFLMESLEHIWQKKALLRALRGCCGRLLIRTNASTLSDDEHPAFGGSMLMAHPDYLLRLIKETGWRVTYFSNRRPESWPTLLYWQAALQRRFGSEVPLGQFAALSALCELGIQRKDWWIHSSPLLEIGAE